MGNAGKINAVYQRLKCINNCAVLRCFRLYVEVRLAAQNYVLLPHLGYAGEAAELGELRITTYIEVVTTQSAF